MHCKHCKCSSRDYCKEIITFSSQPRCRKVLEIGLSKWIFRVRFRKVNLPVQSCANICPCALGRLRDFWMIEIEEWNQVGGDHWDSWIFVAFVFGLTFSISLWQQQNELHCPRTLEQTMSDTHNRKRTRWLANCHFSMYTSTNFMKFADRTYVIVEP